MVVQPNVRGLVLPLLGSNQCVRPTGCEDRQALPMLYIDTAQRRGRFNTKAMVGTILDEGDCRRQLTAKKQKPP